jgi:cytochrome c oxidase subunit 2
VRRGSIIQLVAIGLVAAGVATAVALLIPWLPPAYGKEAQRIHFVFWFATAIAIAVFAVVAAVMTYAIVRFRARPDDDADGPPTHGHTKLEIVWTAIPAVLVTAISIVSAVVLAQNSHATTNPLLVNVRAQQFAWAFTYPNGKTYGYLTIPEGRSTKLRITSNDVIHSFWVPVLSQKQDAVPGQFNTIVVTPTHTGDFPVICTELCGLGHALMRSHVVIMKQAAFNSWYSKGGQSAGPAGLAVFQANGCSSCHTFKPANATATIGPDLDKLKQYAQQAHRGSLTQFIHESIVSPGAYIQPGYQDLMPHNFGQSIPSDKLNQLVQYLAQGASS